MKKTILLVILTAFLGGCGARLIPVASPDVTVDLKDNTISSVKDTIAMTVAIAPQNYVFYGLEDTFLIYFVQIENRGKTDLAVTPADLVLLDEKGHQVNVMPVDDVAKVVEQNLFYLIPYPYVGYYSQNQTYYEGRYLYNPETPHVYSVSPRDLYMDAFPWGKILPGAYVKGKVYFKKRVSEAKELRLRAFRRGNEFLFTFIHENK